MSVLGCATFVVLNERYRGQTIEQPALSLFTPQTLKEAEEAGEFDVDSNLLGLKPDPVRLVQFLKDLDRADVSSDLFVQLLEAYRDSRAQDDADPLRFVGINPAWRL